MAIFEGKIINNVRDRIANVRENTKLRVEHVRNRIKNRKRIFER